MTKYDYIIAGGGLSGLSLAYYLNHSTLRNKSVLIIDQDDKTKDDRTWSFWEKGEQNAFARAAALLRFEPTEGQALPVTPEQVNRARRMDDRAPDLWTTFNRVQENVVRGGLRSRNANGARQSTRAVTGIDQDVKLNRALWTLAEEMQRLKAAH